MNIIFHWWIKMYSHLNGVIISNCIRRCMYIHVLSCTKKLRITKETVCEPLFICNFCDQHSQINQNSIFYTYYQKKTENRLCCVMNDKFGVVYKKLSSHIVNNYPGICLKELWENSNLFRLWLYGLWHHIVSV